MSQQLKINYICKLDGQSMELPLKKLSVIIRSPHDKSGKTQSTHLGVKKGTHFYGNAFVRRLAFGLKHFLAPVH